LKFLNLNRVLCLSPHPDDVEYGMLGTMMKYSRTRFDVITTSVGGNFDKSSGNSRYDECKSVCDGITNINSNFLKVDYIKNTTEDKYISLIESEYNMSDYQCIFIPPEEDTHQDHKKISVIGKALTRKSKCSIIDYKTPHTLDHWIPNLFVDVEYQGWYEEKIKRLQRFESQQHQIYFKRNSIDYFHSNYQCSMKGVNRTEMFRIIRSYV
jgi:LmbE family N-acetylglucosaminyl deacetylase